jgi:hypothetical protein
MAVRIKDIFVHTSVRKMFSAVLVLPCFFLPGSWKRVIILGLFIFVQSSLILLILQHDNQQMAFQRALAPWFGSAVLNA